MTCEANATKFLITFLILISVINSFSFAKDVAFEIDEEDSPKWVIELFQNENERYVFRKFRIPSNDIILYGAAETEDETSSRILASKRSEQMALRKFSKAVGFTVNAATFNGMELVQETCIDYFDEDGRHFYQTFCLYRINRSVWDLQVRTQKN